MMLGYVCQILSAMFVLQIVYSSSSSPLQCDRTIVEGALTKEEQYECLVNEMFVESRYNPLVRPVKEINETLTIEFSVQLSQIVDIDEKNQMMKTNVWLQMYWTDYQLLWDDKKYPDVKNMPIAQSKAWTPDIVLFNNADGNYEVSYTSNTLIYPGGYMMWVPPAIYKSSCTIDVQYFPFDEQICDMKFGSWTFNEKQLNFTFYKNVSHLDVSDYLESGAWDLIEGNANITRAPTGTNNQFKSLVIFKLVLRRKTLFYTVNLIIPCVLISFVTISVFILPADAGEKITLCISILLALVVFLLLISKILPPAITIPLISQYLLFTFIMNILAIMATVIVINRNYRTPRTHHMPYWVRLVFLNYLPRILLMKRPDHDERWQDKEKEQNVQKNKKIKRAVYNPNPDLTRTSAQGPEIRKPEDNFHPNRKHNQTPGTVSRSRETTFIEEPVIPLGPEVFRAAESLKYISNHLKKDDDYGKVLEDWKYVARVIDRLLLYIFLVVTIGGTAGLLLKAPHIFESVKQKDILSIMNRNWDSAKAVKE